MVWPSPLGLPPLCPVHCKHGLAVTLRAATALSSVLFTVNMICDIVFGFIHAFVCCSEQPSVYLIYYCNVPIVLLVMSSATSPPPPRLTPTPTPQPKCLRLFVYIGISGALCEVYSYYYHFEGTFSPDIEASLC